MRTAAEEEAAAAANLAQLEKQRQKRMRQRGSDDEDSDDGDSDDGARSAARHASCCRCFVLHSLEWHAQPAQTLAEATLLCWTRHLATDLPKGGYAKRRAKRQREAEGDGGSKKKKDRKACGPT